MNSARHVRPQDSILNGFVQESELSLLRVRIASVESGLIDYEE